MEENVTGSSLIWVHIVCNISNIKTSTERIRISTDKGSRQQAAQFIRKKLNYANCISVILI